jgi:DNA-binding NtrC family response regulator
VRIIATTNRDLPAEVEKGRFRQDLYYRLNVLPVRMKPLRERREEIPMLAEHFVRKHGKALSKGAMNRLCGYDWPGNVRELGNVIERAAVLSPVDEISGEMIAPWLEGPARPPQATVGVGARGRGAPGHRRESEGERREPGENGPGPGDYLADVARQAETLGGCLIG